LINYNLVNVRNYREFLNGTMWDIYKPTEMLMNLTKQ
jgi:hypothetical protein